MLVKKIYLQFAGSVFLVLLCVLLGIYSSKSKTVEVAGISTSITPTPTHTPYFYITPSPDPTIPVKKIQYRQAIAPTSTLVNCSYISSYGPGWSYDFGALPQSECDAKVSAWNNEKQQIANQMTDKLRKMANDVKNTNVTYEIVPPPTSAPVDAHTDTTFKPVPTIDSTLHMDTKPTTEPQYVGCLHDPC